MKRKMEQLLSGSFESEIPELLFSKTEIQVTLAAGETAEGEVYFGTDENIKIRGLITSSGRRLVPGLTQFSGTTIRLTYGIDAVGLEPGTAVKEYLTFITNIGEYRLNFEIQVRDHKMQTNRGKIQNMDEFVQLAKENFREAFRLFNDRSFPSILKHASTRERSLYAGFTAQPVTYQHLEEYLIALGQKEKVTIALNASEEAIYEVTENISQTFAIKKSGWGHLRLDVEVEGDFLEVEKHVLTEEDFIGRNYNLVYIVHADRLAEGIRYGVIRIRSPYQVLEYRISASASTHGGGSVYLRERRARLRLEKDFLSYISGQKELSAWAEDAHEELNQISYSGFDDAGYRLYEAFVLYEEGRIEEAKKTLHTLRDKSFSREDMELAGLYLYLCVQCSLYHDKEAALGRIQSFYSQRSDSLMLLLILLRMDPSYVNSPEKALFEMEELFERGCKHPVLYGMAWKLVAEKENLFHKLSSFWVQVLLYAARRELLTDGILMRVCHLTGYEKEFRECLYRVLKYGCEAFGAQEHIEAMCRYLMLGNPRKPEYFRWYQSAVEQGVRMTRLYEYFMETIDITYHTPLPKAVLIYFTYNTRSLGDSRKAYLYASVIAEKEKNPEIYGSYKEHIRAFAERKILEGRTGEDYALIYQEFLGRPVHEDAARAVAGQIFTCRLYCDNPKIHSVIIRHSQLAREEIYPCVQGVAYPRLYTEDAAILFLDENKRRYSQTINYSCQRMMDAREMVSQILKTGLMDPGTLLNYCENHEVNRENLELFQNLVQSEAFAPAYRRETRKRILSFLIHQMNGQDLDDHLRLLDYREYAKVDMASLMEILVSRGFYEETYRLVEEFGCENMDDSSLLRMVTYRIEELDFAFDEELLALSQTAYRRGVYNEALLNYLMLHCMGPVDDLILLENSAMGFDLDTCRLEQRILETLMFTQDYRKEGEKILKQYDAHAGLERVIAAYLCHVSYGTFVREYAMSSYIREFLEKIYLEHWTVDKICHFALFKELARDKSCHREKKALLEELLKECISYGYTFAFFRKLGPEMLSQYQLDDKMFVEVHTYSDAKVTLYYRLDNGLENSEEYQSIPLHQMYEGIFGKTFTLFYDEKLTYWFEIEKDDELHRIPERVITMNRVEGTPVSKYQQINQILSAHKLQKETESYDRLKQYLRQQQYVDAMFGIAREE